MCKITKIINSFEGKYSFCSNFFNSKVVYNGIEYATSEHAYQAQKSADKFGHDQILSAPTPALAKKYGRLVRARRDWDNVKLSIMEEIVRAKFEQNEDIASLLIETDNAEIIEGNYWGDRFWGVCNGTGQNHLGKILMKIRDELEKPLTIEELDTDLCEYCPRTDFGDVKVNTGPWNLCEGCACDIAYDYYLDNYYDERRNRK